MPKKPKVKFSIPKKTRIKIQIVSICFGLFLIAVLVLVSSTPTINLAESKMVAVNIPQASVAPVGQVAGIEKKAVTTIADSGIVSPIFSAQGVIAWDLDNDKILYQKNPHKRLFPASTTKVMTALIADEYYKAGTTLVVPTTASSVGGSTMGLLPGETMTFRSLMYGMLLNSGNDAAYALAIDYPGGFDSFIAQMNAKVKELGLQDTHFTNPAGLDDPNHYSSVYDMAVIAREVIKDPVIAKIVSTKETTVISYDKVKTHHLLNVNKLLDEPGVIGIKTGYTEEAGENLVGLVDRDGHKILTVVFSSSDRFGETKKLIDWVYSNFKWTTN